MLTTSTEVQPQSAVKHSLHWAWPGCVCLVCVKVDDMATLRAALVLLSAFPFSACDHSLVLLVVMIVCGRFRMDQYAIYFGALHFEMVFERSHHIVNAIHLHRIR